VNPTELGLEQQRQQEWHRPAGQPVRGAAELRHAERGHGQRPQVHQRKGGMPQVPDCAGQQRDRGHQKEGGER
jgi:hypothetical protein